MNRKGYKKQPYAAPRCKVILTGSESFICSVSVRPNGGNGSGSENWGNDENHDGGGVIIFNGGKAPAKQGFIWEDEDDFED